MTEERFQMSVNVCAIIFGIDILVETGTVVHKSVQKVKFDRVLFIRLKKVKIEEFDTVIKELKIPFGSSLSIDEYGRYFLTLEIYEKTIRSLCKGKSNLNLASKIVGILGHDNREPIMHITQNLPS